MKKNILTIIIINFILAGCTLNSSFVPPPSTQEATPISQTTTSSLKKVALLLPLSGNLAESGQAVRNGFLAAYYDSLQHGQNNIAITFIDSNTGNIKDLYNQAINQGAEFVVGPLTKPDVENIAAIETLQVSTLALNTTDNYAHNKIPNLYQFGLSSRDEATQIAKKAYDHNLHQALIITPNTARGKSLATTLNDAWRYFGGTVKTTITYTNMANADQKIRTALNINVDKNSKKHTKFEPYSGNDIDVVFLIASPEQGRQIQPLIRFYLDPNIPVYATSDIYSGTLQANLDMDLEGVTFCDMPWILQPDNLSEPLLSLHNKVGALWKNSSKTSRLYALGIDSYYLMINLNKMSADSSNSFNGATGQLNIDQYQHVYRTLDFAQMRGGTPIIIN